MKFNSFSGKKILKGLSELDLKNKISEHSDRWEVVGTIKYIPEYYEPFQVLLKLKDK